MTNIKIIGLLCSLFIISCNKYENEEKYETEIIKFYQNAIGKELIVQDICQLRGFNNIILQINNKSKQIENEILSKSSNFSTLVNEFSILIFELYDSIPKQNFKYKERVIEELKSLKIGDINYHKISQVYFISTLAFLDLQEFFDESTIVYNTIDFQYVNIMENGISKTQIFPVFKDTYAISYIIIENDTIEDYPNGFFINSEIFKDSLKFDYIYSDVNGVIHNMPGRIIKNNR